jgi:two-component system chemotaxis sensor kinase CheA
MLRQMSNFKRSVVDAPFSGIRKRGSVLPFDHKDKQYRYANIALIIVASLLLCYTLFLFAMRLAEERIILLYMPMALISITGLALLKTRIPFIAAEFIPIILFAVSGIEFFRQGFADGFSGIWIFVIPPLVYFSRGKKSGFIFSAAVFAAILVVLFYPPVSIYYYSIEKSIHIIIVYVLLFVMAHVYEAARVSKEKELEKINNLLESERNIFAVMRDNLKTGLFLMDKDLIIRDNYSHLLEDIFGVSGLGGRKFTDMLTSSLTSVEISTVTDFFDMVRERRFDAVMLEDINPLQELKYTGLDGVEKALLCTFTPIEHAPNDTLIMGNIEDASAKIEMQKQARLREAKRQEEMDTLFEVLQIDPNVFNDIIEDTDYEFETVNNILKNSGISSNDALVAIFQSIHAIKANSIIIGLNNYSKKLHDIETYIKELREKAEVTFDDMLDLAIRIDEVMKDKEGFKASVEKIKSFSMLGIKKSHADILIESLKRAAERTASDIGKKVSLDTSGIDTALIDHLPRRIVKEILLQLVRNAVFHGIEMPEERLKKGKGETGFIVISLKRENEKVHIRLRDDGKGLDFKKIKERAEKMHIIKRDENIKDKNRIFQAIFMPGFSTAENGGLHAGRGVGLDLVRSRIKELGGAVKIQTEPDKGSVFHIFLPVGKPIMEGEVIDNE